MKHGTNYPIYNSYNIFVQRWENNSFYLFNKCMISDYIDRLMIAKQVNVMIDFFKSRNWY